MNISPITTKAQFEKVIGNDGVKLFVIEFFDDMDPSNQIAVVYEDIAKEYKTKASFYNVDCTNPSEDLKGLMQEVGVSTFPTTTFYKNAKQLDKYQGVHKQKVEDIIKKDI